MKAARRVAEQRGRRAEALAAFWLMIHGWRILDHRVQTGVGELDLVARRGEVLAFVEVKRRARLDQALDAVTPRQRDRLFRAASLWRRRRPALAALTARFDVIALAPWRLPLHVGGAFAPEGEAAMRLL